MSKAWQIILALTFARMTMAAQFQSVPALAPWLTDGGAMSFLALGTLTGAYLLPGALVALAGGWLGQTLGDARVALTGLALMTIGGFGGWLTESYDAALGWRMLAGVGEPATQLLGAVPATRSSTRCTEAPFPSASTGHGFRSK